MVSDWYRLMRTLGRSSDTVNQNALPGPPDRLQIGPIVTVRIPMLRTRLA